jgi:hypothetical protein
MATKKQKFKPRHAIERTRDKNYTSQERIQLLADIRDNSLDLVALAVHKGEAKGTASFLYCYEQACLHIDSIGGDSAEASNSIPLIPGFDPDSLVLPTIDA